eukprot:272203-Alexandrium_andersonii.AAC.1
MQSSLCLPGHTWQRTKISMAALESPARGHRAENSPHDEFRGGWPNLSSCLKRSRTDTGPFSNE